MIRRPALWLAVLLAGLAAGPALAQTGIDDTIRGAYREVLGREPTEPEVATFRARMMDAGWSRRHVVRALYLSDEFILPGIVRVFRETLGRDPTEEETEQYHQRMKRRGWTHARVSRALRRTDEYKNR